MKKIFICLLFSVAFFAKAQKSVNPSDFKVRGFYVSFKACLQYLKEKEEPADYNGMLYGGALGYYNQSEKRAWGLGVHVLRKKTGDIRVWSLNSYLEYLQNIINYENRHLLYVGLNVDADRYHRGIFEDRAAAITNIGVNLKTFYIYKISQRWQYQNAFAIQGLGFINNAAIENRIGGSNEVDEELALKTIDKYFNLSLSQSIVYRQKWYLTFRYVFKDSKDEELFFEQQGQAFFSLRYQF